MVSERHQAQLGLASATTVLIATLTILYQGSRETVPTPPGVARVTVEVMAADGAEQATSLAVANK